MSSKRLKRKIWIAAYVRALSVAEPQRAAEIADKAVDIYSEKSFVSGNVAIFSPFDPRSWTAEKRDAYEQAKMPSSRRW